MYSVLIATTSVAAIAIASPFFANWLAEGNVLFTHVKEGTAKAVMVGGDFSHFVMALRGYHVNDPNTAWYDESVPDYEIVKNERGKKYEGQGLLARKFGLRYVGIPPFYSIKKYHFDWTEPRGGKPWERHEDTEVIYVTSFPYILKLPAAETADRIAVTVEFQVSVRVVNPYRALFDTENWLELVSGAIMGAARNYVGQRGYTELVSEYKAAKDAGTSPSVISPFSVPLRELSKVCADGTPGLHELYGVVIERGDIQSVEYAGDNPQFLTAAEEAFIADQKRYATETNATAEANAKLTLAEAESKSIRMIAEAKAFEIDAEGAATAKALAARLASWNNGGLLNAIVAQTEAMASPGPNKTVIWANNPLIGKINGLAEAFDSLGIKTLDQLKHYFSNAESEPEMAGADGHTDGEGS